MAATLRDVYVQSILRGWTDPALVADYTPGVAITTVPAMRVSDQFRTYDQQRTHWQDIVGLRAAAYYAGNVVRTPNQIIINGSWEL